MTALPTVTAAEPQKRTLFCDRRARSCQNDVQTITATGRLTPSDRTVIIVHQMHERPIRAETLPLRCGASTSPLPALRSMLGHGRDV
jgi:hypothetical protein